MLVVCITQHTLPTSGIAPQVLKQIRAESHSQYVLPTAPALSSTDSGQSFERLHQDLAALYLTSGDTPAVATSVTTLAQMGPLKC